MPLYAVFSWPILLSGTALIARSTLALRLAKRSTLAFATRAVGRRHEDAVLAAKMLQQQIYGQGLCLGSTVFYLACFFLAHGLLWPIPKPAIEYRFTIENAPRYLDAIFNSFGAVLLSGAFSGVIRGGRAAWRNEEPRRQRWLTSSKAWGRCQDERWHQKVEELAGRGFTLDALLRFYGGLGRQYMPHYDSARSTTSDVVHSAIIPLSREQRCAYAEVMMKDACVRPIVMVTHSWANIFQDLVAAILADALHETEYDMIVYMMTHELKQLMNWVEAAKVGQRSYWVCAFCVNQHAGMCGGNPGHERDSVTGEEHAVCNCGLPKAFNTTMPTLDDGRSVPCEMNKFDDMMEFLSAANPCFSQVIAVGAAFGLFSRAWCVAEVAAAYNIGMKQNLKIVSSDALSCNEDRLRSLRIANMEASRPEDKDEILRKIGDLDAFDARMQTLLFEDLLPDWMQLDIVKQFHRMGQFVRWQGVACKRLDSGQV